MRTASSSSSTRSSETKPRSGSGSSETSVLGAAGGSSDSSSCCSYRQARFLPARVDPLTLHFSHPDGVDSARAGRELDSPFSTWTGRATAATRLEKDYANRKFRQSFERTATICAMFAKAVSVLVVLEPSTRSYAPVGVVGALALLGGRIWLHHEADQERARLLFAWAWCHTCVVASALFAIAHWRFGLMSGISAQSFAYVAVLHASFAFAQRTIDLPAEQRLLPLVAGSLAAASWEPISTLGQPREALLCAGALLVGELLGHPFELHRRTAFAREVANVPNAATATHPLTLRFADAALESVYAARAFSESYPVTFSFSIGLASLLTLQALATPSPTTRMAIYFYIAAQLLLVVYRVCCSLSADQGGASRRFGWAWCTALTLTTAVLVGLQRRFAYNTGVSLRVFLCVAALHGGGALFQRSSGMPIEPRLCSLAVVALGRLGFAPAACIGQLADTLLVSAALLVGELVGHPLEVRRRAKFAREAMAAGRVPDPAADAAALRLVHPITLRFADGALLDAHNDRRFGESYPVVVSFCGVFIVLVSPVLASPIAFPASVISFGGLLVLLAYRTRLVPPAIELAIS